MKKSLRKTIAAVCMGTMLIACTVYGADSAENLMVYTDNVLSDGSLIYYFEEVAVTLPADWQGKFQIETTDNSAIFYHKASREKWQEKYGYDGGKLFTLSCTVNHDFQELPDFTYIGFSDQSVMNYFMIFPTDFQAYTDDPAIAAEFQQMNMEIDFVKQHAYMLSEGDSSTVPTSEPAEIPTTEQQAIPTAEPEAISTTAPKTVSNTEPNREGDTGSWVQIMDEFEICLLPDWEEVELDEEDKEEGAYYAARSADKEAVLLVLSMNLTDGYTQEEIEEELAEGDFGSMLEVAEEALKQQGYTIEKTEVIHDIPCAFFSCEDAYGIVFMDRSDSVMDVLYFSGEDMQNNDGVQSILYSVRWVG